MTFKCLISFLSFRVGVGYKKFGFNSGSGFIAEVVYYESCFVGFGSGFGLALNLAVGSGRVKPHPCRTLLRIGFG